MTELLYQNLDWPDWLSVLIVLGIGGVIGFLAGMITEAWNNRKEKR